MNSNMQVAKTMFWVLVVGVLLFAIYKCDVLQDEVIAKRKHNKSDIGLGYTKLEQTFKLEEEENGRKKNQRDGGGVGAGGRIGGSTGSIDPGREDDHQPDTLHPTTPSTTDTQ